MMHNLIVKTRASVIRAAVTALALVVPAVSYAQQNNSDTFTVAPKGYVQFDFRSFPDWDATPGTGSLNRDTVELRRGRAGLDGRWKRVVFEISVDPLDDDGVFVKDAYAQVSFTRALRLRVGQFKLPGTRDYDASARTLDFLERSALTSTLGVGRDVGARLDGRLGQVRYDVGLFAGDRVGRDDRAGTTAAGRLTWRVANDLEIGGSASAGRTKAVDSDPQNGPSFRSSSGYRFAEGVYVQGRRTRLGTDAEWTPGQWLFKAEWLRHSDQRNQQGIDYEDLPDAIGTGFYASVRRRLTNRVDAAFRYDYLSFDDAAGATEFASVRPRATDIRARASRAYTLAGSLTLTRWMKLIGDVSAERYTEARSAPNAGKRGTYAAAAARIQLELP